MNNTASKIVNTATSNTGKTYQRTTKRGHFTFALIITSPSGKGVASFHDTEAEAVAKKETYLFYFDRNMSFLKPHDRVALADMRIEIVPVIQTSEAAQK